jgi:hypothetical protein
MIDALHKKGYRRLLAFVRGDNVPMLRGVRPSHRKIARLFYLRFFGRPPMVLGAADRRLPILGPLGTSPVLKDTPTTRTQPYSTPPTESERSAAAVAGSDHESR